MADKKTSEIKFNVELDNEDIPEKITWRADDSPKEGSQESKALIISLWDAEENNTMRIDLWTKDMKIDEMKYFFFQTFMTMSDSYERATGEEELSEKMKEFAHQFAKESGIAKEKEEGEEEGE